MQERASAQGLSVAPLGDGAYQLVVPAETAIAQVRLFDPTGRMVQDLGSTIPGAGPLLFDLSTQAEGLYVLRVNVEGMPRVVRFNHSH